ncbi:hypothetical protein AAMO2058_001037700 [Amorphochlora amoebiformis]
MLSAVFLLLAAREVHSKYHHQVFGKVHKRFKEYGECLSCVDNGGVWCVPMNNHESGKCISSDKVDTCTSGVIKDKDNCQMDMNMMGIAFGILLLATLVVICGLVAIFAVCFGICYLLWTRRQARMYRPNLTPVVSVGSNQSIGMSGLAPQMPQTSQNLFLSGNGMSSYELVREDV